MRGRTAPPHPGIYRVPPPPRAKTGGCKGMFSVLCTYFFITYQARITWRNSGATAVNQRFLVSE